MDNWRLQHCQASPTVQCEPSSQPKGRDEAGCTLRVRTLETRTRSMTDDATNEKFARSYIEAGARNELDALEEMRTSDWQLRWPATDELVPSSAAYRTIHENYPGGFPRF